MTDLMILPTDTAHDLYALANALEAEAISLDLDGLDSSLMWNAQRQADVLAHAAEITERGATV